MTTDNFSGIIGAATRVAFGDTIDVLSHDPADVLEELSFWDDDDFFDGKSEIDLDNSVIREQSIHGEEFKVVSDERWFKKYDNGKIPENVLVDIGDGNLMRPDAAAAFQAMQKAAKKAGVTLPVVSGYRTYDEQAGLWSNRMNNPYPVAAPGSSNHGWATAVDLDVGGQSLQWLNNNADRYGFSTIPGDPIHWEYKGGYEGPVKKKTTKKRPTGRKPTSNKDAPYAASRNAIARPMFTTATALPQTLGSLFAPETIYSEAERKQGAGLKHKGPLPYVPKKYERWVRAAAAKYGVSPRLIAAVGQVESNWSDDVGLTSSAGAVGPMQVMPQYWEGKTPHDIRTYKGNIFAGAYILSRNLQSGGTVKDALSIYYSGKPYAESSAGQWYAGKVLSLI